MWERLFWFIYFISGTVAFFFMLYAIGIKRQVRDRDEEERNEEERKRTLEREQRVLNQVRSTQYNFGRRVFNALSKVDPDRFHTQSADLADCYAVEVYRRGDRILKVMVNATAEEDQIVFYHEGKAYSHSLQEVETVIRVAETTMRDIVVRHAHVNVDTRFLAAHRK